MGTVFLLKGSQGTPSWIEFLLERTWLTALALFALFAFVWAVHRITRDK